MFKLKKKKPYLTKYRLTLGKPITTAICLAAFTHYNIIRMKSAITQVVNVTPFLKINCTCHEIITYIQFIS